MNPHFNTISASESRSAGPIRFGKFRVVPAVHSRPLRCPLCKSLIVQTPCLRCLLAANNGARE